MTFVMARKDTEDTRAKSTRRNALTHREQEIAKLVCRGLSNKDIARELRLSEGTAKSHLHNIFQKLGVSNRCALILALSGDPRV
jgi:two-component system nitrate/nitrite response regulator NarL